MKPMGRRSFLAAATALGIGAGVSSHAIASAVSDNEKTPDQAPDQTAEIYQRDRDLPFIGTEETFFDSRTAKAELDQRGSHSVSRGDRSSGSG